jgi:ribosomal-protein-alanine N-acetyltransferase
VLEVAADDPAATALYAAAGYAVVARRPGYYRIGRPRPVDAEVRRRQLR